MNVMRQPFILKYQKKEEVEKTTFLYLVRFQTYFPPRASRAGYSHHILLSNTCRFSLADFSKSQLGFRRNINPPPSPGQQQGSYKPGKRSCDTCSVICKTPTDWSTLHRRLKTNHRNAKHELKSPPSSNNYLHGAIILLTQVFLRSLTKKRSNCDCNAAACVCVITHSSSLISQQYKAECRLRCCSHTVCMWSHAAEHLCDVSDVQSQQKDEFIYISLYLRETSMVLEAYMKVWMNEWMN